MGEWGTVGSCTETAFDGAASAGSQVETEASWQRRKKEECQELENAHIKKKKRKKK